VIELFTSQGCSYLSAADKLAGELARDPSLIVLSLPVDYWDYLGWKDTLALPGHTNRQRAYSKARGDREVYTPQVFVNGTRHVLGSDQRAIENAVAETRSQAGHAVAACEPFGCGRADFGFGCLRPRTEPPRARFGFARSPRMPKSQSAVAKIPAAPSPTTTWCGAG
jgi:hypothetical protein